MKNILFSCNVGRSIPLFVHLFFFNASKTTVIITVQTISIGFLNYYLIIFIQ